MCGRRSAVSIKKKRGASLARELAQIICEREFNILITSDHRWN
jgi:hypothetical protein